MNAWIDEEYTWWNPIYFILHHTLGQWRLWKDRVEMDRWVESLENAIIEREWEE